MSKLFKVYELSHEIGRLQEWDKWRKEIPFIKWPNDWEIKIIPPFGAAIVRFLVNTPKAKGLSVYLDCYNYLGYYDLKQTPYWELYPASDGDVFRCEMKDTESLIKAISEVNNDS